MKIAFIFGFILVCEFAFCKEEEANLGKETSDVEDPACKSINLLTISDDNRHI